jgi:TRAP-type C4-dicarboxylate transport system permease small subunit
MRALLSAVDRLVHVTALVLGGIILVAMVGITIIDIVFRYGPMPPLYGALDLSSLTLMLIVAISLPYGARTGAHVSVEFFGNWIGAKIDRFVKIGVKLVGAAILAVTTVQFYFAGLQSTEFMEGSQILNIPFELFFDVFAFGTGLFTLVLIVEAILLVIDGVVPLLVDESTSASYTSGND